MPEPDLEDIAEDFLRRTRAGDNPRIEAYAQRHPELAAEIEEMLTSIELMERFSQRESESRQQASAKSKTSRLIVERLSEFDLVREIGRGGMGVVYEAIDRTLDRRVALKVLNDSALATPKHVDRFRREARLAAQLHHTNIVSVFGVGCDHQTHFYAMQYVAGVSLQDVLDGLRATASRVDADSMRHRREAAIDVALALRDGVFAESRNAHAAQIHTLDAAADTAQVATETSELDQTIELSDSHRSSDVCGSASDALPSGKVSGRVSGCPASDRIGQHRELSNTYWRSVARIGLQVADALHYAHTNGILHRDIKPANLLFDRNGTVWVADFGLAKLAKHDDLTETGDVVGTLRYMAPEQLAGQADERTDIHALGQTLYELLTLCPLCDGETYREIFAQKQQSTHAAPRKLNPDIPRDLSTIVQKSTDHEPGKRYLTAKLLAEDLQRFLDDRPILARHVTWSEQAWRWCRRNRALAALAAISSALILLLPVVLGWAYVRESRQKVQTERTLAVALNGFDELFRSFFDNESATVSALSDSGAVESLTPATITKDTARVLERMLVFYDRLAEANASPGNSQLDVESAKARRRVGDLYQRLGQFSKATEAYQEATNRYATLATSDPSYRIEIGRIHQAKGAIYAQQQIRRQAIEEYRQALQVLQSAPAGESTKYEIAQTYFLLSSQPVAEGRGDRRHPQRHGAPPFDVVAGSPGATDPMDTQAQRASHLSEAITLVGELLEQTPDSAANRLLLALCLRESATETVFDPDSSSPRAKAAKLLRELTEQYPTNPRYRFELSETYRAFGKGPLPEEDGNRYVEQLLVARELSEQLVQEQRDVASYRIHLAHIHAHLGVEYERLGLINQAEAATLRSIAAHESVARDFPGLAGLSTRLSTADKTRLASWYAGLQRWEELVELLRPLGDRLAKIAAVETSSVESQSEVGVSMNVCRELLMRAYDELGDADGYLVAFSWPAFSRPTGPTPEPNLHRGPPPMHWQPGTDPGLDFGPPEFREVDWAMSYDTNRDSSLTRDEVPTRMAKEWFDEADVNDDGNVERRELRRMLGPPPP